jgi:hypothetical protein
MSRKLLRTVVITEDRGIKVRVGIDLFRECILPSGADERVEVGNLTKEVMDLIYGPILAKLESVKTTDVRVNEKLKEIMDGLR